MAVQKEIWLSSIVGLLFAQNSFMAKAFNADEYVNQGKTVHIPQAGAPSGVKKNRAELPATVKQRKDSDLTFVLDEYTTDPVHIPHADTVELSYDKRESILRQDKLKLLDEVAKSFIAAWLPTDAECTLKTTGEAVNAHTPSATGKRKAFTADDVLAAMTAFNAADIPQEGRYLLLDAQMYSQLLASLTKTEGMAFLACADAVNGVVGKLHSFNIMLRSTVAAVDVNGALVAEAAATDCAAALAWHEQSVCRALGEVKMYSNEDDPTYYGDIYSFLVRAGGRRMRNDGAGVLAIVQDTVE